MPVGIESNLQPLRPSSRQNHFVVLVPFFEQQYHQMCSGLSTHVIGYQWYLRID